MKAPDLTDLTNKFMVSGGNAGVSVMLPFFKKLPAEEALYLAAWLYVTASAAYDDQEATDEAFSKFVEKIRGK